MIYRPEEANNIAVRLESEAQTWVRTYTKLNSIIAEMNTAFVSQTQTAFNAANESNQGNYIKMKELLEEMASSLKRAQVTMTEADESEARRIRSRFSI